MRSMQWQLGILGTISAFAYRHRHTRRRAGKCNCWLFLVRNHQRMVRNHLKFCFQCRIHSFCMPFIVTVLLCITSGRVLSPIPHTRALLHTSQQKLITSCTNSYHDLRFNLNYWLVSPNVWVMIMNNGLQSTWKEVVGTERAFSCAGAVKSH